MGVSAAGGIMRIGQNLRAFLARIGPARPRLSLKDGLLLAACLCVVTYFIKISCEKYQASLSCLESLWTPPSGLSLHIPRTSLLKQLSPYQPLWLLHDAFGSRLKSDPNQEIPQQGLHSRFSYTDSQVRANCLHWPDRFYYQDISLDENREAKFTPIFEQDQQAWLIITAFAAPTTCVDVCLTTERVEYPQRHELPVAGHLRAFNPFRPHLVLAGRATCSALDGCETQSDGGLSSSEPVHQLLVWPMAPSHPIYAEVRCRELFRGRRVQVIWDETALDSGCEESAHRLGTLVEQQILPLVETWIGACDDLDGDNRLTLAVSPRVSELAPAQGLKAVVRAMDFHPSAEPKASNHRNLVYLAPHVDAEQLPAILMHELAHVAQFCAFRRVYSQEPWPLADWLLEGHAHAVEVTLTGHRGNLLERITAFLACPERSPLVIPDTSAASLWRHPATRGATAAFCVWLTETYGCPWWREIPHLAICETEWEHQFGTPWRELYRQWTLSLAIRGVSPALSPPSENEDLALLRPRSHLLGLDTQANVTLQGTSSAYFRLSSEWTSQGRIALHTRPPTQLQVTFVCGPKGPSYQPGNR